MWHIWKKDRIEDADLLIQSAIPFFSLQINPEPSIESFHFDKKCSINNLSTNIIYTYSGLSYIQKGFRYLNCSEMNTKKGSASAAYKRKECNLCWWRKIYNWNSCSGIWIFLTLQSSLQPSKEIYWTSSCTYIHWHDSHLKLKLLTTTHRIWNTFL